MTTHRFFLLLLLLSGFGWRAFAQNTFSKIYYSDENLLALKIVELPNGGWVSNYWPLNNNYGGVVCWDEDGIPKWGVRYEGFQDVDFTSAITVNQQNEIITVSQINSWHNYLALLKLNEAGQKIWDIRLGDVIFSGTLSLFRTSLINTIDDGYLVGYVVADTLVPLSLLPGRVELSKINDNGGVEWAKKYDIGSIEYFKDAIQLNNGNFLYAAQKDTSSYSNLVVIDPFGIPLWSVSLSGFVVEQLNKFPNGDILLIGGLNNYPVIARIDNNGNLIWAKKYNTQYSGYFSIASTYFLGNTTITQDGKIRGAFGSVNYLMDGDGNLESAKSSIGIPFKTNDGGYLFLDFELAPPLALSPILKKTGPDAEVPGCESHRACLELEDVPLEILPGPTYTYTEITFDTTAEGTLVPFDFYEEDYCEPDPEPLASFVAPATVCVGDCFELDSLQQQNAEYWQWDFSGLSSDADSVQNPGEICAPQPGTYELQQIIGYNGCLDSFSLTVEVQPGLMPDLGPNIYECETGPVLLDATTPGATSYLWDDLSTDPIREVGAEGQYTVTVMSDVCEGSDAVKVSFFDSQYPDGSLELGPGISGCEGEPVTISPTVPQGLEYAWSDGVLGRIREFYTSGTYTLTGSLNGCSLSETIVVSLEDCDSHVYMPTAFSPNDDGLNDVFQAYGVHFQVETLKVFDRWGGLVYDGKGSDAHWDGYRKDKVANPGVYVYILEYANEISGAIKMVSGEVTLVR
ncbi:MAG: T9SS type B sorting domain-containing protein [Bacteroidetes bacterium]|nr:T9SS type B sorting domain-containing protein [Bacteroidota bacterium]